MKFVDFLEAYFKSIIALAIALIVLMWVLNTLKSVPIVGPVASKAQSLANGSAYS